MVNFYLAGGSHVRWEQLTGEDKRQGLDPKLGIWTVEIFFLANMLSWNLDREDQKTNCYKTSPLEH